MHRFSFARSPAGGLARLAFWLGRDEFSGEGSRSGGYAPLVPGGAKRLGHRTSGSTMAGAVSVVRPSAQAVTPEGQPPWAPLLMEPATGPLETPGAADGARGAGGGPGELPGTVDAVGVPERVAGEWSGVADEGLARWLGPVAEEAAVAGVTALPHVNTAAHEIARAGRSGW